MLFDQEPERHNDSGKTQAAGGEAFGSYQAKGKDRSAPETRAAKQTRRREAMGHLQGHRTMTGAEDAAVQALIVASVFIALIVLILGDA